MVPEARWKAPSFVLVSKYLQSTNGELNLEERYLQKMDYALASIHPFAFTAGSRKENTLASVRAFQNPYVKILGHPDDGRFL